MILLVLYASPAAAQSFTNVYFFGDSLTDNGNVCALLVIVGYAPGVCSNGPVWSEYFGDALGFDVIPSSAAGANNFAVGSNQTVDLDDQIFFFSPFGLIPADPDALYVIWLGGNNVLALPTSPTAMEDAVDDIINGLRDLQDLGAQHFLIPNLPDIGRAYGGFSFPTGSGPAFTPAERDLATALSLDFNDRLATALAAEPIVTLYTLDIEALVEEIFADPALFGLAPAAIDTTSDDTAFGVPCLVDSTCAADPQGAVADDFFLFDAIHPTTAAHALVADRALLALPEPGVAYQLGLGSLLVFIFAHRKNKLGSRAFRR